MTYYGPAEVALRAENVDRAIKNIAASKYIMKNLVMQVSSNSAEESYYRESIKAMASVDDIPKLAGFPRDDVLHEKKTGIHQKFGLQAEVSWEDVKLNRVDVVARALMRIGNRIANRVDNKIWDVLSESQSPSEIHEEAIGGGAPKAGCWDATTYADRRPHYTIGQAIKRITDSDLQSYMPNTILVNPYDYSLLITNDDVIASFDASGPKIMERGHVGRLMGLNLIVSPVVTDDKAMVLESKTAATWKSAQPMTTARIIEEGIRVTIRGWEIGMCQLTDPKAVCLITNTNV